MQWKYPKKELLWSQLLLFFHLLKHYAVYQWCISWEQWQISNREIKSAVFPVFICSDQSKKKRLRCSFLPENCSKHALVGSRWVSGADQQYIMSIFFWNLRYETDRTCCWLFLSFWVSISLQSPSRQYFCCFLMFFTKECINFA